MPSVEWNRYWDRYDWPQDGEEWDGQARSCGQPYEAWKASLLEAFLPGSLGAEATVLEVAPGHGRWSEHLIATAARVHLVDLNPACIEFCRARFEGEERVEYHVNDGRSLPFLASESVDFVWSYDSFVHMEGETIGCYLGEFARVLRSGGGAVIHHADRGHVTLPLAPLRTLPLFGRRLYQLVSMPWDTLGGGDGDRGAVSCRRVRSLAREAGLTVERQTDRWGSSGEYDCRRFGDAITVLSRP